MATSCSWKAPVKQSFTVSAGWNFATCTWEISSFSEVLYERFWKNYQNSHTNLRSHHPVVFCHKMFLKTFQTSKKISLPESGNLKLSEAATGDVQ